MKKNSMLDLHDYLFTAIERLSDEGKSNEEIKLEVERSKAIAEISSQIIDVAKTSLRAAELQAEYGTAPVSLPEQFRLGEIK